MMYLIKVSHTAEVWLKYDFEIEKSADFDKIQSEESPAVSGRSKSGDAAAVALLSKGYGDIALVNFVRHEDNVWKKECLIKKLKWFIL